MLPPRARNVEETGLSVPYAIGEPLYNFIRPKSDWVSVETSGIDAHVLGLEQMEPLLQSNLVFSLGHSLKHKNMGDDASPGVMIKLAGGEVKRYQ